MSFTSVWRHAWAKRFCYSHKSGSAGQAPGRLLHFAGCECLDIPIEVPASCAQSRSESASGGGVTQRVVELPQPRSWGLP
jgi:hypothetical protein